MPGGYHLCSALLILHAIPAKRQGASAGKLHVEAAKILHFIGIARSKQGPVKRGHGAQYLYIAVNAVITHK